MVLRLEKQKIIGTKPKPRFFQTIILQSSTIFKTKNNMDKSPWVLTRRFLVWFLR